MVEGTGKRQSMSIDGRDSRGAEANSSDDDTFFTLWFYSIKLSFPRTGICEDN